jgi:predicted permease
MPDILGPLFAIFFFLGLGFMYQRWKPFEEQTLKRLAELVADVFLPILLFYLAAFEMEWNELAKAPAVIGLGLAVPVSSYLVATAAMRPLRIPEQSRSSFRYGTMVGNTTFIGLPVCEALFGPAGVMYAVLYDFGTTIISLTLGVWELKGGNVKRLWPLLLNPLILAMALGLLVSVTGLEFPAWVVRPFEMVSGVTLPLALVLTGAQVSTLRAAESKGWPQIFGQAVLKLMLQPLLVFGFMLAIGWTDVAARVVIVEAGMPVGLITVILAKSFGADAKFASAIIFWTTLASFITLPLLSPLLLLW